MYFLDPDRGKRRRAGVRDKVTSSANSVVQSVGSLSGVTRDMRNRAYGMVAETKKRFRHEEVTDEVLEARIRSKMGHQIPHPEWVDVRAENGVVTLSGRVPASDADRLLSCVENVNGVREVENEIDVH